ncbi:MAG: hypothetical protein ABUK08_00045 [Candidatus Humimicrobiaceae bacterium]
MDFGHLKKLEIKDRVIDYPIEDIQGEPVPTLKIKPATQSNKPYFNAILRKSKSKVGSIQSGNININMLDENRTEDKKLFPKHVISGWNNVKDSSGESVLFTFDNCNDFINALPNWIFDKIRNFAATSENFVEEIINVEEKAKN